MGDPACALRLGTQHLDSLGNQLTLDNSQAYTPVNQRVREKREDMSEIWRDVTGHLLEVLPSFISDGGGERKWLAGRVFCPEICLRWERQYHEGGTLSLVLEEDEYIEGRTFGWWRISPTSGPRIGSGTTTIDA